MESRRSGYPLPFQRHLDDWDFGPIVAPLYEIDPLGPTTSVPDGIDLELFSDTNPENQVEQDFLWTAFGFSDTVLTTPDPMVLGVPLTNDDNGNTLGNGSAQVEQLVNKKTELSVTRVAAVSTESIMDMLPVSR